MANQLTKDHWEEQVKQLVDKTKIIVDNLRVMLINNIPNDEAAKVLHETDETDANYLMKQISKIQLENHMAGGGKSKRRRRRNSGTRKSGKGKKSKY